MSELKIHPGKMPDWGRADLSAPPPFNMKNIITVMGPGTIALSMAIGGAEWMMGPALVVKYGAAILWVATVSIFFQTIFNQEVARYVMYTGETIFSGFMRTSPGPRFWGWFYTVAGALQVGWPGAAAAAASTIFAALYGKLPGAADKGTMLFWGYISFGGCFFVLLWGGIIERGLEKISSYLVLWVVFFLLLFNLLVVPAATWWEVFKGFFQFGMIPKGADWLLLGAFASYAGAGGIGNLWTASWLRDKGYGMGKIVGSIPSALKGKDIPLSKIGSIFDPSKESNMVAWKTWWKYLGVDQGVVFGGGCILGLYLCVLIGVAIIPAGSDIKGLAAGAYQAEYMMKYWKPLWFITLITGFWILWGTQLAVTDGYCRVVTDIIWSTCEKPHTWKSGPKTVYYISLLSFVAWGCIAINLAAPLMLLFIAGNMAGFLFVVSTIHILVVNYKFLPKELHPPIWRTIVIIAMMVFYAFFLIAVVGHATGWWTIK